MPSYQAICEFAAPPAKWALDLCKIAVIPLVVLIITAFYNERIKESENRVRYVEIAVTVLKMQPSATTVALRQWAVDVLADKSPIEITCLVREQLMGNAIVPDANLTGTSSIAPGKAMGN